MGIEWFGRWFSWAGARPDVDPSVLEKVVDRTDPRLRLLPGYARALRAGVRQSLTFSAGLGERLDTPLPLSLRSFTTERRLGLFFSSPASLLAVLERSEPLQQFFRSPSLGGEAHALLLMQRSENLRFGCVERNGEVINDVAHTVVSFDHHRIILPCPSRAALLEALPMRGLEVLLAIANRHLVSEEQLRAELEGELMRVEMKLATLPGSGALLAGTLPSDSHHLPDTLPALKRMREELQGRIAQLRQMTELTGVLKTVCHILEHPADYFRVSPARLMLDRMGVLQSEPADAADATEVTLEEVVLGHGKPMSRAVVPVVIHYDELMELRRDFGPVAQPTS